MLVLLQRIWKLQGRCAADFVPQNCLCQEDPTAPACLAAGDDADGEDEEEEEEKRREG